MQGLLEIYRANLRINWIVQFQYRVALMIWMLWLVLEPIIYLSVWSSVARSQGGAVGGFTPRDFAAYYITVMVVMHFTQIWHMWEYDYIVRQGLMSARLMRPLHPIHTDATQNISYKVMMLIVIIPAVILLTLLFRPTFSTELWAALAFIPAVTLAGVLAFILGWCVAMAAFWTTRIIAINEVYFVMMFILAGQFAPLDLLPRFVQQIAAVTPFRYIIAFPVELAIGRLTVEQTLNNFAAQMVWIAVALFLLRFIWKASVRRYTAFGG
jgi:ABC-2 type transport system permease protein